MTRGKYAAKAKNRLANLDNELLQDAIRERDELRRQLAVARLETQAAERSLASQVLTISEDRAARLAAASKLAAEESARAAEETLIEDRFKLGLWIAWWIKRLEEVHGDAAIIPGSIMSVLCYCSPTGTVEPFAKFLPTPKGEVSRREFRRRTDADHRRVASQYAQVHHDQMHKNGFGHAWTDDIPEWKFKLDEVINEAHRGEEA